MNPFIFVCFLTIVTVIGEEAKKTFKNKSEKNIQSISQFSPQQKKKNRTKSFDQVTAVVGRLSYITIPFHQVDGASFYSDDWNFLLRTDDNQPLFERSWIQYNKELHQIEAFPLKGNEGDARFLILPWIPHQKSHHRYFFNVNVKREKNVYMHQVIFNIGSRNSARINRQLKFRIEFIELLATYLSSMGLYVRLSEIQILDSNPSTGDITWLITNIKPSSCDHYITKRLPKFLLKDNKPNMNLLTVFSRKAIVISNVKVELFPPCSFSVSNSQSQTNHEYLAPLIVVIVIIVLVSPVIIAIFIRRKFQKNRGRHQTTHVSNYSSHNHPMSIEQVTNFSRNTNRKFSFSCWMFSRKGKSFKINRHYRNHNKDLTENIFHPNYLRRERLRANSTTSATSFPKNSPKMNGRSRLKEQSTYGYSSNDKKQVRQPSGISEASSNPSYSTSQDTHHSSFDKRRYSPTANPHVQMPLFQQQPQLMINSQEIGSRQQLNANEQQRLRSHCNQSNSLLQSMVSKVCDFVVNDGVVNNHQERRASVHLINTKPKTVNIHASTHHQQNLERIPKQSYHIINNSPYVHKLDHPNASQFLPRRHSLDTRQSSLQHQRSFEKKMKSLVSCSTANTPTKSSTLKVNSLNKSQSKSADYGYQSSSGSLEINQRFLPSLGAEKIKFQSRSAVDLNRPASIGNMKIRENQPCIPERVPSYQRRQDDETAQYHTNTGNNRERKTSLARRQEFLTSRRKAIELCSHEEAQNYSYYLHEDYEDSV